MLDKEQEKAWIEDCCKALANHSKRQWEIGDLLLKGWDNVEPQVMTVREMNDAQKIFDRRNEPDGEDHKTKAVMNKKLHNPYEIIAKRSGYSKGTLVEWARISTVFPVGARRKELTWSHHQAVAALKTEKQRDKYLDIAETQHLSVDKLRGKLIDRTIGHDLDTHKQLKFPVELYQTIERVSKERMWDIDKVLEIAIGLLVQKYPLGKKAA